LFISVPNHGSLGEANEDKKKRSMNPPWLQGHSPKYEGFAGAKQVLPAARQKKFEYEYELEYEDDFRARGRLVDLSCLSPRPFDRSKKPRISETEH
jgi:hypothetical protein